MAIGAVVGKAAKKVKKPVDAMPKKERDALKKKKDIERKAARAASRQSKKESKQKIAPSKTSGKEMMGGNKPLATTKPKSMSRASAGPKRMEKVVKGEVVKDTPKVMAGDKAAPKTDAGSTRKGINKKSVAGVAAATALGAAGIATMDKKKAAPEKASEKFNMVEHAKKTKASSPGKKAPSEFGKAFQSARKAGKKDEAFEYKGKKYHKYTKEEVAKMSPEEKKALRKKGVYV